MAALTVYMEKGRANAFLQFEEKDFQYNKYSLLADYFYQNKKIQDIGFQEDINYFHNNIHVTLAKLQASKEPLAKAYWAYWLLVNNGVLEDINNLMNAAIKETFTNKQLKNTPPFDFNVTYSYTNLEQLILHLRYLHAASDYAIPCWLFEKHPVASKTAFSKKSGFASLANTKIADCQGFDTWKEIAVLNAIISDLQPEVLAADQLERHAALQTGRSSFIPFSRKIE